VAIPPTIALHYYQKLLFLLVPQLFELVEAQPLHFHAQVLWFVYFVLKPVIDGFGKDTTECHFPSQVLWILEGCSGAS